MAAAPTLLQQQFDREVQALGGAARGDLDRLWATWGQLNPSLPVTCLDTLHRACGGPQGAKDPLFELHQTMIDMAAAQQPLHQLHADARRVVELLVLCLAEQLSHGTVGATQSLADGTTVLILRDPFAVDVAAATTARAGMARGRSAAGQPQLKNVRHELEPITLDRDSAEDQLLDVLASDLDGFQQSFATGDELLQQAINPRPVNEIPPDIYTLLRGLDTLSQRHKVRPVILVQAGRSPLASQASLRTLVERTFKLRVVLHDAPASSQQQSRTARDLEALLTRKVAEVLRALDPPAAAAPAASVRRTVFISYAHVDGSVWRDRTRLYLNGLPKEHFALSEWTDEKICTGDAWHQTIEQAMDDAAEAILILTAGFFASDYIKKVEVPKLLSLQAQGRVTIRPVYAEPCNWQHHPQLSALQALSGDKALLGLDEADWKEALRQLADDIFQKHTDRPRS